MDSQALADMLALILERGDPIDSVTVVRNGYLVTDAYVYPFRQGEKHILYSCTKSVVSALIGIAIEQGHIEGVKQPVLDFFPGREVAHAETRKDAMTLEHLLTMSTGLRCEDSYLYRWRGLERMRRSEDWVQFMLDLPMAAAPGRRFEYCNGASFLLSAILQETTGMTALAYAEQNLFAPLGISDVAWASNPHGVTIGYSELHMTPHDMAKIGYLYLNGGQWEGRQIVPAKWVTASTRKHIGATLEDGYGYQWWIDDSGYYMALGYSGQFIFVVPKVNVVVAFTSHLPSDQFYVPQRLLNDYVLPATKSVQPLPANPDGVALLASYTQDLADVPPID
jgi:CubicO group peptidase (beta-lactamase class C family)